MIIAIVDDSAFQRNHISRTLSAWGHKVHAFGKGQDLLDSGLLAACDLLITDLLMPEMDGRALVTEVRRKNLTIPIVVLTADVQNLARQECLDSGASDVIHKPPTDDKLRAITEKFRREKAS
jgi:CheY-like chemotaxis protein